MIKHLMRSIDVSKTIIDIVERYELDIEDFFHIENEVLEAVNGAAILELLKIEQKLAKSVSFEVNN